MLLQVLCIQGFLACRKHADRIVLLVEMMQGSGCPAFKAGPRCVHNLRKRFHLGLTETQVSTQHLQTISSLQHILDFTLCVCLKLKLSVGLLASEHAD